MRFVAELLRRNVVRIALAYLVFGWVLLQIADLLLDLLGVPDWGLRLVFGILALGFPVAIAFAWIFELTPDGLRRDTGTSSDPAYAERSGQRLNIAVIILLLAAIGISVGTHFLSGSSGAPSLVPAEPVPAASAVAVPTLEASIAILPFAALSEDANDAFFSQGIAEELLNSLARFPDLKVAARTSAFAFEGQSLTLQEIAERLGVRHLLEGSVRRAGERVRVHVQLTRAVDGFSVWSQSYDRTLTDLFAIQDEIVEAVSRQLQVRLGIGAGTGRADSGSVDPRAYEQYLQGLALWGERDSPPENRIAAIGAFRVATQVAPDFADAWAALGYAIALSGPDQLELSNEEFIKRSKEGLKKALSLDEANAAAHAGMVRIESDYNLDFERAQRQLALALESGPNVLASHYAAAQYYALVGNVDRALAGFDRALLLDPLNEAIKRTLAIFQVSIGRVEEATAYFDDCALRQCAQGGYEYFAVATMIAVGDADRARRWFDQSTLFQGVGALPDEQQPPVFRMLAALVDFVGTGSAERLLESMPSEPAPIVTPGLVAPLFLQAIEEISDDGRRRVLREQLLSSLVMSHDDYRLISEPFSMVPYYGAVLQYPDWVLADARYRQLWSRPGLAELAELRRANGFDAGLPKAPAVNP